MMWRKSEFSSLFLSEGRSKHRFPFPDKATLRHAFSRHRTSNGKDSLSAEDSYDSDHEELATNFGDPSTLIAGSTLVDAAGYHPPQDGRDREKYSEQKKRSHGWRKLEPLRQKWRTRRAQEQRPVSAETSSASASTLGIGDLDLGGSLSETLAANGIGESTPLATNPYVEGSYSNRKLSDFNDRREKYLATRRRGQDGNNGRSLWPPSQLRRPEDSLSGSEIGTLDGSREETAAAPEVPDDLATPRFPPKPTVASSPMGRFVEHINPLPHDEPKRYPLRRAPALTEIMSPRNLNIADTCSGPANNVASTLDDPNSPTSDATSFRSQGTCFSYDSDGESDPDTETVTNREHIPMSRWREIPAAFSEIGRTVQAQGKRMKPAFVAMITGVKQPNPTQSDSGIDLTTENTSEIDLTHVPLSQGPHVLVAVPEHRDVTCFQPEGAIAPWEDSFVAIRYGTTAEIV